MKPNRRNRYTFTLLMFLLPISLLAQERIKLDGSWAFSLDPDSTGLKKNWALKTFSNTINLPGTTDEAKYGTKTSNSDYGILTRAYKYIGPAWYQREIEIPASWKGHEVVLFIERVLWESRVYIDGKEISRLSPLYTPHTHSLGILNPGKHKLSICINNDMIHNIGDKGHGYGEYTQSIWNGIVGKLELVRKNSVSIESVKIYPGADRQSIEARMVLARNNSSAPRKANLEISIEDSSGKAVRTVHQSYKFKGLNDSISITLDKLKGIKAWDEFHPNLYTVRINVKAGNEQCDYSIQTGFRKASTSKHKILINDKVSFMRGNLDCVHFPLTGYPSCDVEDWIQIFKKYKDYGLNMVRFHSWCPPEAAFEAADKVGIYIQAEILWIDWWMTSPQKERPEMYTKGTPEGLGKNPSADAFVQVEMKRILDTYGNHPSFVFFCIGNELGNSDFIQMEKWIQKAKQDDPRRLYAVSTARKIMPVDDYMVTHYIPDAGYTYGNSYNATDAGLEAHFQKANIPIIAHEVGQYPVYPDWNEINKYTGVLKARNLEGFKAMAEKNGIAAQSQAFHQSSGKLQQLLYKNLIENVLLSPSAGGFQMLSMADYQGQGEALVGWLDCFWDDKGITTPKRFRQHSNAIVPLIRTKSFTYTSQDTIKLGMALANYSNNSIKQEMVWNFSDAQGNTIIKGTLPIRNLTQGQLIELDKLTIPADRFPAIPAQYTLTFGLADKSYQNSWNFFIFPAHVKVDSKEIYVAKAWNQEVDQALAAGKKVLLLASRLGTRSTSAAVHFSPLFWSSSFFPGQGNETLGSLIDSTSAAFNDFPSSDFTNWQWYKVSPNAKYFRLSDMPLSFRPLVQPISDFHFNEKLGSIFETRVGRGKLLVCGYDLEQPDNVYAQQLYKSLTNYMRSNKFDPLITLPEEKLKNILRAIPVADKVSVGNDQFAEAILYVKAGAKAADKVGPWASADDETRLTESLKYSLTGATTVKKGTVGFWRGNKMSLLIYPPQGIKGYLYIHLTNNGSEQNQGLISIEGREVNTGKITDEGKWIRLFMMREDTNDGIVNIEISGLGRYELQVDAVSLMKD